MPIFSTYFVYGIKDYAIISRKLAIVLIFYAFIVVQRFLYA